MNDAPTAVEGAPASSMRDESELPWVPYQEGVDFQLLRVDEANETWVIRARFQPGVTIQRHEHTGEVFAFTHSGAWRYLEYPEVNTKGSFLYEPPGAIHTLHVLADNDEVTDVSFVVRGKNIDLDDDGNVLAELDGPAVLAVYRAQCEELGHPPPNVMIA